MRIFFLVVLLASPAFAGDDGRVVQDRGIAVELAAGASARAGESVEFTFRLSDTTSQTPLTGRRPAAWLTLRRDGRAPKDCTGQVATYLSGDLFSRADVDLNTYLVVAMNDDASLSVVDPLFGFGGSKLLAWVELPGRAEDWALSRDQATLYVSIPSVNQVAMVDTRRWQVVRSVRTGVHPRRLVLHDRVFVATDEGVTVLDHRSSKHVRTGMTYDLAAGDGVVYAATGEGTVAIDVHTMKWRRLDAYRGVPSSIAYSSAARMAYVLYADQVRAQDGTTIATAPGATQIRFAPRGRYGLIANPTKNLVQVLDAARGRIVQNAQISDGPDQVTFTDLLAYVRRRASETILMITLDQLGAEGKPLSVADFPGGQHAYGEGAQTIADSIVPSVEGPSVLVANPADKMIYLYKEGMAAPAGGFSNYGRQPRAALVVDRGLRETKPGTYVTSVPVARPGRYDVAFFLDAPRVVACFGLTVEPKVRQASAPITRLVAVQPPKALTTGQPARLRFNLTDAAGRSRRARDVRALALEAPGVWQQRGDALRLSDGTYEFTFTPPSPGTYYLYVESGSLGLFLNSGQFLVYEAQ